MKILRVESTLAALVLGGAVLAGCSSNSGAAQDMVVPVKISQAQQGIIGQGNIYTGTVTPSETVNIVPKVGGKVVELPVDIGSEVKRVKYCSSLMIRTCGIMLRKPAPQQLRQQPE